MVLFNRDIKPGGLAEYGIYPDKHVMKRGLRQQFHQVLDTPGLTYCGNVTVGSKGDLTLDDLRAPGFQSILVCAGAQGIKWRRGVGECPAHQGMKPTSARWVGAKQKASFEGKITPVITIN